TACCSPSIVSFESCRWVRTCNESSSRRTFSSSVPKNGSIFPAMCIVRLMHVEDFSDELTAAGFPKAGNVPGTAKRLTASRSPIDLVSLRPNLHGNFFQHQAPLHATRRPVHFTLTHPSVT